VTLVDLHPRVVGIDVEAVRPIEAGQLAEGYFSSDEYQELALLSARARELRFFDAWTLKEAYAKAIGDGLHLPLNATSFRLAGNAIDALFPDGSPSAACALFAAGEQYRLAVAAIAAAGEARPILKNGNAAGSPKLQPIACHRDLRLEGFDG